MNLDPRWRLYGPLGFDFIGDNAPSETVITKHANFPDACHRIKNALRPVIPKNAGEDRQENVSVLGRMSWHGPNRHHRHLTYEICPAWARSRCGPCAPGRHKRNCLHVRSYEDSRDLRDDAIARTPQESHSSG